MYSQPEGLAFPTWQSFVCHLRRLQLTCRVRIRSVPKRQKSTQLRRWTKRRPISGKYPSDGQAKVTAIQLGFSVGQPEVWSAFVWCAAETRVSLRNLRYMFLRRTRQL